MFELLKTYDFAQVYITLDGRRITGFGADGGVKFTPEADLGEHDAGADGLVTFSRTNDKRVVAEITVKDNSAAYVWLSARMALQQLENPILPMPFFMRDINSGEQVSEGQTVFINVPEVEKVKASGDRVFRILLPYARDKFIAGINLFA